MDGFGTSRLAAPEGSKVWVVLHVEGSGSGGACHPFPRIPTFLEVTGILSTYTNTLRSV